MKNVPVPFNHQVAANGFVRPLDQFALFADQGTGKSRIVIDKTTFLYEEVVIDKVVIICLNFLKHQWLEEFDIHCKLDYTGYVYQGKITSHKKINIFNTFINSKGLKVMCVNVEAFQSNTIDFYLKCFMKNGLDTFIVVDESVSIKNPKAKRTKKILKGFKNRNYKCILSGTPTPNSPADLYSQFDFLKAGFFKCSHFQFQHRHILLIKEKNKVTEKPFFRPLSLKDFKKIKNSMKEFPELTPDVMVVLSARYNMSERNLMLISRMEESNFSPFKDMVTLNQQISSITYKITKKECLDIPDKIYEKLLIELSPEQKRLIKELKKDFMTMHKNKLLTVQNALSALTRYRMITGGLFAYRDELKIDSYDDLMNAKVKTKIMRIKPNPKTNALKQDLETVSNDTCSIIWACYVEELKYIYDELKDHYSCALYYGATSNEERVSIVNRFKQKDIKILIANPQVAGMGLNLQVSTLQYFYSNDYRSDVRLQAEDRSHRAGQVNKVTYKDLIALNSIDERIYDCLQNKINIVEYFKNKDNLKNIFY